MCSLKLTLDEEEQNIKANLVFGLKSGMLLINGKKEKKMIRWNGDVS